MKIARRTLFKLFGCGAVAAFGRATPLLGQPTGRYGSILLAHLPENISEDQLQAFMAPLLATALPVAVVLESPGALPEASRALLRRAAEQAPNLVELLPFAAEFAGNKPYFQMRAASRAVAELQAALSTGNGPISHALKPVSLATTEFAPTPGLEAARIAGIRSLVAVPGKSGPARMVACSGPVQCYVGGLVHAVGTPVADLETEIERRASMRGTMKLVIDMSGAAGVAPDELGAAATELAGILAGARSSGTMSARLPRELAIRSDRNFLRLVALWIDAPPAGEADLAEAFADLEKKLGADGINYSVVASLSQAGAFAGNVCPVISGNDPGISADAGCAYYEDGAPVSETLAGTVALEGQPGGMAGIDGAGVIHIPADLQLGGTGSPADALAELGGVRDVVLRIPPEAYRSRARRNVLVGALRDLHLTPDSDTIDVAGYAMVVRPLDPVFDMMAATARDSEIARPEPGEIDETERTALLEDARLAWTFFDKLTDSETGLCIAAVQESGPDLVTFDQLTMWDYGSLIQATLAARELGLIDEAEFALRAERLVASLPVSRIGGRNLPQGQLILSSPWMTGNDYNSCDTGRLLSALRALHVGAGPELGVEDSVAKWDLASTVRNGRLLSISKGRDVTHFLSHCTQYAARGFSLWGHQAESPYAVFAGDTETDARMNLLYRVADIGALGAEPLLLEAVEMGFSSESAYLSDVLFSAQYRSFRETGKLVCVSEGPLPEDPWFSYQGLQLDAVGDPWRIETVLPRREYLTEAFRKRNFVVSVKAAFLWAAVRPHEYSRLLLEHVRQNGRIEDLGFASGIYVETGLPTVGYSDVNTNGVILQAIAYALRGRRPTLPG